MGKYIVPAALSAALISGSAQAAGPEWCQEYQIGQRVCYSLGFNNGGVAPKFYLEGDRIHNSPTLELSVSPKDRLSEMGFGFKLTGSF